MIEFFPPVAGIGARAVVRLAGSDAVVNGALQRFGQFAQKVVEVSGFAAHSAPPRASVGFGRKPHRVGAPRQSEHHIGQTSLPPAVDIDSIITRGFLLFESKVSV